MSGLLGRDVPSLVRQARPEPALEAGHTDPERAAGHAPRHHQRGHQQSQGHQALRASAPLQAALAGRRQAHPGDRREVRAPGRQLHAAPRRRPGWSLERRWVIFVFLVYIG